MAFDWTSRRILIADSDEQFRFYVRSLFKHQRVKDVLSVVQAGDVVPILAHHRVDVAFVELPRDETAILRMLAWLRGAKDSPTPRLPLILLTKTLDRAQLARVCVHGVHGILQKPVSGEKLLNAAIGAVANPRMFKPAGVPAAAARHKPASFAAAPLLVAAPAAKGRTVAAGQAAGGGSAGGAAVADAGRRAPNEGGAFPHDDVLATARQPSKGGIEVVAGAPPATGSPEPAEDEVVAGKRKRKVRGRAGEDDGIAGGAPALLETASAARPARAPQTPSGPSVEEILAAHAQWVQQGGKAGQRAGLSGHDLSGCNLTGALLTSAMLRRADLSGSDLSGAEFHGADLREAEMQGARLVGTDLAVARLRHANLRGCQLSQASLKGADLAGADLTGARLDDADLSAAILVGARLDDADLTSVSGLTQGQLDGVRGNAGTRLPFGLALPPDDGA